MKTPTLPQFKAWTQSNHRLARAVCLAQAFAQVERERVTKYIALVFEQYHFFDQAGTKITEPERLYLSQDEALCSRYYEHCDRAHREHGFTGPRGHCPALEAQELQRQAEAALLDAGCELMEIDNTIYGKDRAD